MGSSSMQHTIGSAIERARQDGLFVEILVENHWLDGTVVESDGHGVVLENEGRDRCVVRLEHVSAVRISADSQRPAAQVSDVVSDLTTPMPYPHATAV
jgi:hypothetical protein